MAEFDFEILIEGIHEDPKLVASQSEDTRRSIITEEERIFGLSREFETIQTKSGLIRELKMLEQWIAQEQLQMIRQTLTIPSMLEHAEMVDSMVEIHLQSPEIGQMNGLAHETRFDQITARPHEALAESINQKPSVNYLPHLSCRFFERPAHFVTLPERRKYEEEIRSLREENQALKLELDKQKKHRDDDKGHPGTYL